MCSSVRAFVHSLLCCTVKQKGEQKEEIGHHSSVTKRHVVQHYCVKSTGMNDVLGGWRRGQIVRRALKARWYLCESSGKKKSREKITHQQ